MKSNNEFNNLNRILTHEKTKTYSGKSNNFNNSNSNHLTMNNLNRNLSHHNIKKKKIKFDALFENDKYYRQLKQETYEDNLKNELISSEVDLKYQDNCDLMSSQENLNLSSEKYTKPINLNSNAKSLINNNKNRFDDNTTMSNVNRLKNLTKVRNKNNTIKKGMKNNENPLNNFETDQDYLIKKYNLDIDQIQDSNKISKINKNVKVNRNEIYNNDFKFENNNYGSKSLIRYENLEQENYGENYEYTNENNFENYDNENDYNNYSYNENVSKNNKNSKFDGYYTNKYSNTYDYESNTHQFKTVDDNLNIQMMDNILMKLDEKDKKLKKIRNNLV